LVVQSIRRDGERRAAHSAGNPGFVLCWKTIYPAPSAGFFVPEDKQGVALPISVVCLCFNEAGVLSELVRRLSLACESAGAGDYEIILVDDGSTDGTWAKIRDTAEANSYA
jgi:cellulose synthase/poly-beta-1,6-N-acetylglucosamine synthase-like glycosyltransferase